MRQREFRIEGSSFCACKKAMIIAEIGTGHNGSLDKAKELVDAAREAGADAAKFQIVYADEILHPDTGFVNLPGGRIPLFERFRELEVDPGFYADIARYCRSRGLIFLASPFGLKSLAELERLEPSCIKIASPELNHFPLLRSAASLRRPLILSSGVSTLADIERALEVTSGVAERALLHCVTSYPAPEEEYNISVLESISAIFGIPVGVSDHSLDPLLVPLLATAYGAAIIEKHICLSRADPGLDDPVALPPEGFSAMTKAVRESLTKAGDPESLRKGILEVLTDKYGREKIERVIGNGIKRLAPSEEMNYRRTNRSLHFVSSLTAGHRISAEDVAILRTEKVLTPGLSPEWLDTVVGATLTRDITAGAGIEWKDLIGRPSPR